MRERADFVIDCFLRAFALLHIRACNFAFSIKNNNFARRFKISVQKLIHLNNKKHYAITTYIRTS